MPEIKSPIVITKNDLEERRGTVYPAPYNEGFQGRVKRAATDVLGLSQFGVNIVTLEPGSQSSQRHWHENEDEFVYILEGDVILLTDSGETKLSAGMMVGFPAGHPDGHCLINKSDKNALLLEVGTRAKTEKAFYSDIDMKVSRDENGAWVFTHKDGRPYK